MSVMHIRIAERLRPFTCLPGMMIPLPGSSLFVQVFPARISVFDASQTPLRCVQDIPLRIRGPVDHFTAQLDLESGVVRVWGFSKTGFFRYGIQGSLEGFSIQVEKDTAPSMEMPEQTSVVQEEAFLPRLSLGSHKKQDWELVLRRRDFRDIMPLWYRLGKMMPEMPRAASGTAALVEGCRDAVTCGKPEGIILAFDVLFRAGFTGLLAPTLVDEAFQGIVPADEVPKKESPMSLLTEGAALIESLFVKRVDDTVEILPTLPPEFHCGRMVDVPCSMGLLNLEWRKKLIRRMIWTSTCEDVVTFRFRPNMKTFRLRRDAKDVGTRFACGVPITISKGQTLWLDCFEK